MPAPFPLENLEFPFLILRHDKCGFLHSLESSPLTAMLLVPTTQNHATCGTLEDKTGVYCRHMTFAVSLLRELSVIMTQTTFKTLDLK